MTITEYRETRSLSLRAFAKEIGKSAAYICAIENGARCPASLALKIEAHTGNLVDAATLSEDVAAARRVAA